MGTFLAYMVGLFVRPRRTLRRLAGDPRGICYGFFGLVVLAAVYFIGISIALAMNVAHSPEFLVLDIPAERYYSYERFFILPVGLAGTILASGVVRLLARWWKGMGRFEDLFALLGFSMIEVALVMGLPDIAIALLAGAGVLTSPGFTYIGPHVWLGTAWYLMLAILAVKEVERLAWGKTIVLAVAGFAANGVVQFIFIR
jgi:hypothetical protein